MTLKKRIFTLSLLIIFIALLGIGIQNLPDFDEPETPSLVKPVGLEKIENPQIHARFNQAVAMLNAKEYQLAFPAFHEVLSLAPKMPEAHVNMGFTLIGLERHVAAKDFFISAIELNPEQANAYYGLALVYETEGDFPGAIGAMRTYIHRTHKNDPHVKKARAALWEWEEKMAVKTK